MIDSILKWALLAISLLDIAGTLLLIELTLIKKWMKKMEKEEGRG